MTRLNDILNGIKKAINSSMDIYPENEYQEDRLSLISEDDEEENETPQVEMNEYKQDFYEMSVGSIKSIMTHAANIVKALEDPNVKNNLTESWLQGKIAVTEDYMITIHNFVMFGKSETDTEGSESEAADRPGLWENIRKKKEREGKKYRPAKPGDKDRPDPDAWKQAQK
jgi:hypothetical protein